MYKILVCNRYYPKRTKLNRIIDDDYMAFRKIVLARDSYTCQFPGCNSNSNLEVHHIKKYSRFPHLRLMTYNGITLCASCHKNVTGHEETFELMFFNIVAKKEPNPFADGSKRFAGIDKRKTKKKKTTYCRKRNNRYKRK